MYVDTTVVWNVLYRADNCKLETRDRHNGNGLHFLDTQPDKDYMKFDTTNSTFTYSAIPYAWQI